MVSQQGWSFSRSSTVLCFSEEGNRTVEMKTVVEEVENLTHFSTFALSATNGTVRWHHLPGDFGQQTHNIKVRKALLFLFPCTITVA